MADQASVPDVIVDMNGYVRVYYVDYFNQGIVMAISKDLENWAYIKVKGINESWVDPSIVILPDGKFRLYASYMPLHGEQNKILSAISDDGIHFKVEPGVRYEGEGTFTDPDVIYANGKWIMYLEEISKPEPEILVLTSEDGLTFKKKTEIRLEGQVPCLIRYGEGYRLYLHKDDLTSILTYYSEDLENWGSRIIALRKGQLGSLDEYGVADPSVARLPNGTYIMVYKTWIRKFKFEESASEKFYKFGIGAKVDEVTTARLAYLLDLDWIRLDSAFIWGEIEPTKGSYDFERADSLVRDIQQYGVRIIAKITSYAEWDYQLNPRNWSIKTKSTHIPSPPPYKPNDMEAYKEFVKRIVERYDGDGIDDMPRLKYPIKYWTILNEPGDQFQGTGKEYAETLKASYEAIKEADPEAKVNIAAPGDVGPQVLGTKFWEEALRYSKGYFDYGNIHYNVGASGIDKEGFEDLSKGFRIYRDHLSSFGIENIKVWGTEISPAPGHLPIDEKARLWVIGTVKSFTNGAAGLKYPFVFLEDEKMMRMFLTITTLLKNFDEVEEISKGCYKFYIDGSEVFVVWAPGELPNSLTGKVYVVDIYGNVDEKDAASITPSDMAGLHP